MQETQTINNGLNAEIAAELDGGAAAVLKRVALWGTLLLLAFLLGFIPLWLSNRETTRQRDAAQANLRLSQLQNRLATAAMSARRGEYEASRIATSDFLPICGQKSRARTKAHSAPGRSKPSVRFSPTATILSRCSPATIRRRLTAYRIFTFLTVKLLKAHKNRNFISKPFLRRMRFI